MLQDAHLYAKLPASDLARARRCYVDMLGFQPIEEGPGSIRFRCTDGSSFVAFLSSGRASGDHDQCGWIVDDIQREVAELRRHGIALEEFPGYVFEDGIGIAPRGHVVWFRDSEGNLLDLRSFDSSTKGAPDHP